MLKLRLSFVISIQTQHGPGRLQGLSGLRAPLGHRASKLHLYRCKGFRIKVLPKTSEGCAAQPLFDKVCCRGLDISLMCFFGHFLYGMQDVAHSYGDHARFGRLDITKKELKALA